MNRRILVSLSAFLFAVTVAQGGAWGYKSFENDDALDWVENSLKRGGQRAVEKTITRVARERG